MARTLLLGVLCAAIGLSVPAVMAQPTVDLNADQRALIEQLTADKALAVARERRIAADEQEALNRRLDEQDRALRVTEAKVAVYAVTLAQVRRDRDRIAKQRQKLVTNERGIAAEERMALNKRLDEQDRVLQAAEAKAAANAVMLEQVRGERDGIAKQRQELVAALAERDRALAAEVRAYREIVTGIATSSDPLKQKALQRFADGDQRKVVDELREIAAVNRAARIKAAYIAEAADLRPAAWLALQAYDNGKMKLEEVVQFYKEITRLDPGIPWDWIVLARLYSAQGRLVEGRKAAQSAQKRLRGVDDAQDRSMVLNLLGRFAWEAGDFKEAKAWFEEGLGISRKLAQAKFRAAGAQYALSEILSNLGAVAMDEGNYPAAKVRFLESLGVQKMLVQAIPSLVGAQHRLSECLRYLGMLSLETGDLPVAKARFEESLSISRKLAQANPASATAQQVIVFSLSNLGELAVREGKLQDAKTRFEEGLGISRKLAQANPTSAQGGLSVSLFQLGELALNEGNLSEAKARLEEGLGIIRKLPQVPTRTQFRLHEHLTKLGEVAVDAGDLVAAKTRFEESLAISRKVAQANPMFAAAQYRFFMSHSNLGDLAMREGNLQDAKTRFEEALSISRRLAQANPTFAWAQGSLSISLSQLGRLAAKSGDLSAARVRFEEALDIRRKFALASDAAQFNLSALLDVATGERGYQIHRHHRYPGTHPVARRRSSASTVSRRRVREPGLAAQGRAPSSVLLDGNARAVRSRGSSVDTPFRRE